MKKVFSIKVNIKIYSTLINVNYIFIINYRHTVSGLRKSREKLNVLMDRSFRIIKDIILTFILLSLTCRPGKVFGSDLVSED